MIELMLPPFVACMVLVAIHSYLGLHVIARGVIFVDLSLAQMAALGTTTGLLVGVLPESNTARVFALAFTLIGAALFAATRSRGHGRVPQEAIIGIVYVVASAAALLIAAKSPRGEDVVKDILVGKLLWVTWPTIGKLAVAYLGIGVFLYVLRRRFETVSFEPEKADALGWRIRWLDFWFYAAFGIVITFSVPIGGVLMVFSFLVVPAVTAFLFTRHPRVLTVISWCTGAIASAVGLALSYQYDLPTGPVIVCTFGAILLLAGAASRFVRPPEEDHVLVEEGLAP